MVSRKTVISWKNNYDTTLLSKLINFSNLYNYSLDYILELSFENNYQKKIDKLDKKKI